MDLLDSMLEKLNAVVDQHNAAVRGELDIGNLTADEAKGWLVEPGCVTRELVMAGPQSWPPALRRAVREIVISEAPDEIIRLCDACPVKTDTVRHLRIGSERAPGAKPGPLRGFPVGVRLMDLAYLVAQSDKGKAILLG